MEFGIQTKKTDEMVDITEFICQEIVQKGIKKGQEYESRLPLLRLNSYL